MCQICELGYALIEASDKPKSLELADKISALIDNHSNADVVLAFATLLVEIAAGSPAPREALEVYATVNRIIMIKYDEVKAEKLGKAASHKTPTTLH